MQLLRLDRELVSQTRLPELWIYGLNYRVHAGTIITPFACFDTLPGQRAGWRGLQLPPLTSLTPAAAKL